MKKVWSTLMVLAVMATMIACATTKQEAPAAPAAPAAAPAGMPAGIVGQTVVETVMVDAIDYKNRTLVLKDAEGNSHFMKAGPEIRNFPQIKVGDEVIAEHTQSVAILVDKPKGKPAGGQAQAIKRAPLGAKPAMDAINIIGVSATVEKIDYDKRMITLKGPEGKVITTKVDPSLTRFNEVKKGDMIYMQITEELAIRVETPKK
jgi:hypothetical protein